MLHKSIDFPPENEGKCPLNIFHHIVVESNADLQVIGVP